MKHNAETKGRHKIFRPYVIRNGKFVYPKKGKALAFWVNDKF